MAKIILEFDGVEEFQDARIALDGIKWKSSIWDLDQKLRNTTKHGMSILATNKEASDIELKVAEKYREVIWEILEGYSLNLDIN